MIFTYAANVVTSRNTVLRLYSNILILSMCILKHTCNYIKALYFVFI